ncbi:MAG: deaminase domain-containing protein, partial [Acidobacteriota bacterium]
THYAVSGKKNAPKTVGLPDKPFFHTFKVDGQEREYDSERKLLEHLHHHLSNTDNSVPPEERRGRLKISSELLVCKSCHGVVEQFQKIYPNIQIETESGPYKRMNQFRDNYAADKARLAALEDQ